MTPTEHAIDVFVTPDTDSLRKAVELSIEKAPALNASARDVLADNLNMANSFALFEFMMIDLPPTRVGHLCAAVLQDAFQTVDWLAVADAAIAKYGPGSGQDQVLEQTASEPIQTC